MVDMSGRDDNVTSATAFYWSVSLEHVYRWAIPPSTKYHFLGSLGMALTRHLHVAWWQARFVVTKFLGKVRQDHEARRTGGLFRTLRDSVECG